MSSESTALDATTPEAKTPRRWLVPLLAGIAILAIATAVALGMLAAGAVHATEQSVPFGSWGKRETVRIVLAGGAALVAVFFLGKANL